MTSVRKSLLQETRVIAEITDGNFEEMVIDSGAPFLLLFRSPGCVTCKKISPYLDMLSQSYPKIRFGRLDISTNAVIPSEYDILSIPSLVVFSDGKELTRLTGHLDESKLGKEAAKFS
jgi:thioredoxin 1